MTHDKEQQLNSRIDELEAQLTLYKTIVDQVPISVFAKDVKNDYRYLIWNKQLEQVFGTQSSDILGINDYDLFENKQEADYFRAYDVAVMQGGETVDIPQEELRTVEGIKLVHTRKIPIYNTQGEPLILLGCLEDITERMQISEALKESELRYKQLFENINLGFALHEIICDPQGKPIDYRYIEINQAFEKLTGFKRENTIGHKVTEILPTVEPYWIESFGSVAISGNTLTFENYVGEMDKYFQVTAFCPRPMHFAVLFSDVTAIKKSEKEIREARQLYHDLVETAQDLIWKCDEQGRFVFLNSACEKIYGYTVDEMLGRPFTDFMDSETAGHDMQTFATLMQQKGSISGYETVHLRKDGHPVYLSFTAKYYYDEHGTLKGTQGTAHDMTKRKRIENELIEKEQSLKQQNEEYETLNEELTELNKKLQQAKEKAEESDRLKSAFLANMSHEIRTPMNGIIGFADLLNEPETSGEKRRYYTDIIKSSSLQLLGILNDIVDISKIETGMVELNEKALNINNLLLDLFTFHKPIFKKNNTNLFLQNGLADNRAVIVADEVKLRQIINNLLSNALKFTHIGHVAIGYELKSNKLIFSIEDTGIGIAPDQQELIFDRFRQAKSENKLNYGGTGLGLAIAKAYVEKMGGSIWLKSTQGTGSTFYFSIPYQPAHAKNQPQSGNDAANADSLKNILIVEDEETNHLYLAEVLNIPGIKTIHARTGAEALNIVRSRNDLQLILMDIKLPDTTGYELTKQILTERPYIPVVAQTAYALSGDEQQAREAGCTDYLAKPIPRNKLLGIINKHLKINLI